MYIIERETAFAEKYPREDEKNSGQGITDYAPKMKEEQRDLFACAPVVYYY